MGEEHTKGYLLADDELIKATQSRINGHMSMIMKAFKVGEYWNQEKRFRETSINESEEVAPMYLVVKDHKITVPGTLPKTRPIISGCKSMTKHLAGILSDIIEALAYCMRDPLEDISTEDMLAVVEDYNLKVLAGHWQDLNPEDLILLGADVVALFPSLDTSEVAKEVMQEILESDLKIQEVEWKDLARYIAMNMDGSEVKNLRLDRLIPVRKYSRGPRPGITSKEAKAKDTDDEESKWEFPYPDAEPVDWEVTKLVAYAIQIAVEVVFNNYLYSFAGHTYRQVKGGPIGS